jgi:pimeloyl-ACP methyl ester carboxylesterase
VRAQTAERAPFNRLQTVETQLGRFPTQAEVPEPLKFAWPIVVLPELFTTSRHLATLVGYFATIGWEVYAPDLSAVMGQSETPLEKIDFAKLTDLASEAIAALGREAIVVGHGIGGLVSLKLAERSAIKASVGIAPLAPGFRTPLFMPRWDLFSSWQQRPLNPPTRRTLFEFVADADVHSREQIIKTLTPGATAAALEVVKGDIEFATSEKIAPRLIVAGESDIFAPYEKLEQFAHAVGAPIIKIAGRGHWLIGGRGLERAINEIQRFLVRSLGRDLLLLYPEEWKRED